MFFLVSSKKFSEIGGAFWRGTNLPPQVRFEGLYNENDFVQIRRDNYQLRFLRQTFLASRVKN
jgi:hypothetical protein